MAAIDINNNKTNINVLNKLSAVGDSTKQTLAQSRAKRYDEQYAQVKTWAKDLLDNGITPTEDMLRADMSDNLFGAQKSAGIEDGAFMTAIGGNAMWNKGGGKLLTKVIGEINNEKSNVPQQPTTKGLGRVLYNSADGLKSFDINDNLTRNLRLYNSNYGKNVQNDYTNLRKLLNENNIPVSEQLSEDNMKNLPLEMSQSQLLDLVLSGNQEERGAALQALEMAGATFDGEGNIVLPRQKTIDDIIKEKQDRDEQLQLAMKQQELERQKNRSGLAELAAVIGDIIKGSNGAPVTARDLQTKYDQLTKQQQLNYDNYIARKNREKALELENERLRLKSDDDWNKLLMRLKAQKELEEGKQKGREALADKNNAAKATRDAQNNAAKATLNAQNNKTKENINAKKIKTESYSFGGDNYTMTEEGTTAAMISILAIINNAKNISEFEKKRINELYNGALYNINGISDTKKPLIIRNMTMDLLKSPVVFNSLNNAQIKDIKHAFEINQYKGSQDNKKNVKETFEASKYSNK